LVLEGQKCFIFQLGLTDTLSAALPLHCIQLFETTAKHEHSATKVVAVSSAMSPVVTARTVASERGVGGQISRSRTWCRKLEPLGVGLERRKPSVRSQAETVCRYRWSHLPDLNPINQGHGEPRLSCLGRHSRTR
jgi:hypothetical protein